MKMYRNLKKITVIMMLTIILFITGCGSSGEESETPVDALQNVNQIPEDGVITKAQFTQANKEYKELLFVGETEEGISYSWKFNTDMIKNPQDQNLKLSINTDVAEELNGNYPDASEVIAIQMEGQGLIAVPDLTITLPEVWTAAEAKFVQVKDGELTELNDVTISIDEEKQNTILETKVISMSEVCYIIGIKAEDKNTSTQSDTATEYVEQTTEIEEITTEEDTETTTTEEDTETTTTEENTETTTAKKQETTTAKKQETTTAKKEETTTAKKEETTTAKKQETTTAKKEETTTEAKKPTCTISISCATILDNMDQLDPAKKNFVPSDGWILKKTTVTFEEGESVHDVLKRVCREKGIHMESTYTPIYDSAYVEGINQLYEFDCGSESGWMYKVNGWFPNYGSSQYKVADGDVIAWVYTCNLGTDVGDNSMQ